MILKKLHLYNFKNFTEKKFSFSETLNAFVGNNGVGKTNVLDAINMLAFGKSYFSVTLNQIVRHGENEFAVKGVFIDETGVEEKIQLQYKKGEKKILKRNEKVYERMADHIGLISIVMISPYDRDLISEGGEIRRKFLDKIISQFDKGYLADLTDYYKILSQRNSLLKYFAFNNAFDPVTLEVYNEKLHLLGSRIYQVRKEFIKKFRPFLQEKYRWLSSGSEQVDIVYKTTLNEKPLKVLLEENLDRDRLLQHTTQGIHRDDLIFLIDGYPIRKFGSQGQQKSYLIALKLAEYESLKEQKKGSPVLLFDDIFDKLDPGRVKQIVRWVENNTFGQVFLTDTYPERLEKLLKEINRPAEIFRL